MILLIAMESYLTVEEVAEKLHLHPGTVRRFISEGGMRATKIGGRYWRISESAVQEFIDSQSSIAPMKIKAPVKTRSVRKKRTKRPSS